MTGASGAADEMNGNLSTEALLARLLVYLRPLGSVAVGFSGGVDSTVVVAAAMRALGASGVLAVTADSETLPAAELEAARQLAAVLGASHAVIRTHELECQDFAANAPDRCYHCKTELWGRVGRLAADRGIRHVADGVNADDLGDFRPGIRASDEAGVVHPLAAIGAGKQQVRQLAAALGLANWDKPAQACLSSRFPYGSAITAEGLRRVEAAEEFLRELGLSQLRVRSHGDIARIEVPDEAIAAVAAGRAGIVKAFRQLGFAYVTLDLEGFRSGSMNETLAPGDSGEKQ